MTTKSLIYIDGMDNYLDIELFYEYEEKSEMGYVINKIRGFKIRSFKEMHKTNTHYTSNNGYKQSRFNRRMTLFSIAYTFLVRELEEKIADEKLNQMQLKLYKFREKYGYRSKLTLKLKREIHYQKLNNEKRAEQLLEVYLWKLYELLPERYKSMKDEVVGEFRDTYGKEGEIILKSISINIKGLSYLEQQNTLGRVKLNDDSLLLLRALKDFARYREENMTFDGYIDNWIRKLLEVKDESISYKENKSSTQM